MKEPIRGFLFLFLFDGHFALALQWDYFKCDFFFLVTWTKRERNKLQGNAMFFNFPITIFVACFSKPLPISFREQNKGEGSCISWNTQSRCALDKKKKNAATKKSELLLIPAEFADLSLSENIGKLNRKTFNSKNMFSFKLPLKIDASISALGNSVRLCSVFWHSCVCVCGQHCDFEDLKNYKELWRTKGSKSIWYLNLRSSV